MTDQSNAAKTTKQGYNLKVKQTTVAEIGSNSNGKLKITFRGKTTVGGREIDRKFVAQGEAAEKIQDKVALGADLALRCIFENAPAKGDEKKGGEFLTVVGEPLPPKKKAA